MVSLTSAQPNLPLASPMAGKPSQPPLSGGVNVGKSPPAPEMEVKEKEGGLSSIPMKDRPFWRKVMTCIIVQGWLMLVSSLLVIFSLVADLGGHCTSGSPCIVVLPYSLMYSGSLSSSWCYDSKKNNSSRTPTAYEEPTSTHSHEYPNCGDLVLALLSLILSYITVVFTVLGLILLIKKKMSLCRLVSGRISLDDFLMSLLRLLCGFLLYTIWINTTLDVVESTSVFLDHQNSPAMLTAFSGLFLLCFDVIILSSAYLQRKQLKNHEEAMMRAQAQVIGFSKVQAKSQGSNVGNLQPSKLTSATEIKSKEKKGGLLSILMEDPPFCRKVMTWSIVQGWLMLLSSLLVIFLVVADLGGHCTNGSSESHVISPYSSKYPKSLNYSWRYDSKKNNSSRTPTAYEEPTSTHGYEYPNCGDLVLALLSLVLSYTTVVFTVLGLILVIKKKMSLYRLVCGLVLFAVWINTTFGVLLSTSVFPDRESLPAVLAACNFLLFLYFDIVILLRADLMWMQRKNLDKAMRAQAGASRVVQV